MPSSFTEFYCTSAGDNRNGGSTTGAPTFTNTGGNWVNATRVFTASGATSMAGIAVGMFASIFADGATVASGIGRISAVSTGARTITLASVFGTNPTDGTGNRSMRVEGAWKGPNGTDTWPFATGIGSINNASSHFMRVNLKNDQTYNITAALSAPGGAIYQGYTSTPGDGGRATVDAGTTAIAMMAITTNNFLMDLIFSNNGTTGANAAVSMSSLRSAAYRCVAHDIRGPGFTGNGAAVGCEAYNCNTSNTANSGGFQSLMSYLYCISHHNSGSNNNGFYSGNSQFSMNHCIAHFNGLNGVSALASNGFQFIDHLDSYRNGGAGLLINTNSAPTWVQNSNFLRNGTYGIDNTAFSAGSNVGGIYNSGFGAGTMANTSGTIRFAANAGLDEAGNFNYSANATPWSDPDNGDFRIILAAAKAAGLAPFLQTQAGYAGTVGYPDVGAAQSRGIILIEDD